MSQPVLVINTGSSSIKYQLLTPGSPHTADRHVTGLVERIGEPAGTLTHGTTTVHRRFASHQEGLRAMLDAFRDHGPALDGLAAVGHRVVHGGDRFAAPVLIDDTVEQAIEDLTPLAPLHNPANLKGIRIARHAFPGVPQVAVFDTAFHQSLPPAAHTYAVPRRWARDHGVRRYGFHGTSVGYVSRAAAALLGLPPERANLIVLHLGNGASATAVAGGASVDTSMGLTPLQGLVMGSRSGDVDPALPAYLNRVAGLTVEQVDAELNGRSGLLGLAGASDLREVHRRADGGDTDAALALEVYCHRIRGYVGAYYAGLSRVDAVVFTAGVGEHDDRVRAASLRGLQRLGIAVDAGRNTAPGGAARFISPEGSEVAVLVVPTDEELEIARQALALLGSPV